MEHVEKRGVGSTDPSVLRLLQDVVASAPRMPAVQFDQMFNSQVRIRTLPPPTSTPTLPSRLPSPRPARLQATAILPWSSPPHPPPATRAARHQVQDMLVVVYLANLTRTQLALAEKLQSVALSGAGGA